MKLQDAVDIAWAAIERQARPPVELFETITVEQAYQVQLEVLGRYQAAGEKLAGWKIGGNSAFGRKMFGDRAPFSGFLLESKAFPTGQAFVLDSLPGPALIESELCITFGRRLEGPNMTRADVLAAASTITPAFEVAISKLGVKPDLAQLCADDAAQWGYVLGAPKPFPDDLDFGGLETAGWRNDELFERAFGRDKVDDQIDSIVWLVGQLHRLGRAIEIGHRVLSGSCLAPAQLSAGESWRTSFGDLGDVSATFN